MLAWWPQSGLLEWENDWTVADPGKQRIYLRRHGDRLRTKIRVGRLVEQVDVDPARAALDAMSGLLDAMTIRLGLGPVPELPSGERVLAGAADLRVELAHHAFERNRALRALIPR